MSELAEQRVLIVVPALNEERSVGDVVYDARALGYDVCVVDDGSTDATATVAADAGATVLRVPINLGVGGALRCGFRWALARGYDVVVQLDADGQHDPREVATLLAAMRRSEADMVIGSRFAANADAYAIAPVRRLAMRVLARRASRLTGTVVRDSTSGFRAIRRPLLDRFAVNYPVEYLGDTVEALIEAGRSGARIVEQPVAMFPRRHGNSSASALASVWYVLRVIVATELTHHRRWRRPPRLPSSHGVT